MTRISRTHALLVACLLLAALPAVLRAQAGVSVTEADENVPTYLSGAPDPNPMFFFGTISQGAEERIYPYPLHDNLLNRKVDKRYRIVYLENEYVKVGIAPELGGRIFSAVDKSNGYDYIYHQHVIKPALIGLTGAWISGGVEWNIPHHHRASTFCPVQYSVESLPDGGKRVWVGELEVRHRMRWSVGYTLRPGSSVLDCTVRIANRTPLEHTMLCFANIAVSINDDYQVIFPPRTQLATGHHKREFFDWPLAQGGKDMSWYKNNTNSASWFAVNYEDDFVAGYDHGREAGIIGLADHNVSAGKKFFTWGKGKYGQVWDGYLTDTDGPYLEIMMGAYSDNQPDYSWLQPGEAREFDIHLLPFRGLGGVKNANLDASVNLEVSGGKAVYGFASTRPLRGARITLTAAGKTLAEQTVDIDPAHPLTGVAEVPAGVADTAVRASLCHEGRELVAFSPLALEPALKPAPYTEPRKPEKIDNDEELFLTGQRIDQFHDPFRDADPYWLEALRRDSCAVAANTGMGIICLRKARYAEAERYLSRAVARLTARYTTPKNVEPLYYLGLAQRAQGNLDAAYTTLYRAAWKQEWKAPAYYELALIKSVQGDYAAAFELVEKSLDANGSAVRSHALKAAMLRRLGRTAEALAQVETAAAKCDVLDPQLMAEEWLATGKGESRLFATLAAHPTNAQEVAAAYLDEGLADDGLRVLAALAATDGKPSPLTYYYMGHFAALTGNSLQAAEYRAKAKKLPADYVFPFQEEMIDVLRGAMAADSTDARAPYYLGNLLYDWQPEEAEALWEKSVAKDPKLAVAWRNIAVACSHKSGAEALAKAVRCLERAVSLKPCDPTHLVELDIAYRRAGTSPAKRLAMLEKHQKTALEKDNPLCALIEMKTFAGKTDEAIALLSSRTFNIREGGNKFSTCEEWTNAHIARGMRNYTRGNCQAALADFLAGSEYPANLRVNRESARISQIRYLAGLAHAALGDTAAARALWAAVAQGDTLQATDANALPRTYAALAHMRLGDGKADTCMLRQQCDAQKNATAAQGGSVDYQFGDRTSYARNEKAARAHYLAALAHAALGDKAAARREYAETLRLSPDYLAAKIELDNMK